MQKLKNEEIKEGKIERYKTPRSDILDDQDKKILAEHTFNLLCGNPHYQSTKDMLYRDISPKLTGGKIHSEKDKDKYLEKATFLFGLDTIAPLWESVANKLGLLAMQFTKELYEEYSCETATEKALAQTAANAFVRILEYSNTLETCRNKEVNTNLIGYYSLISKELDRADRHLITAMTTLKQIKRPPIKVNVKTKNAFVAENQQFNQNLNNEKIKPK